MQRHKRSVTVSGRRFVLDRDAVEAAIAHELPDPIREHYVVVGGRRFPPKQVLSAVTGLDRADFTTHQARRILTRLGFSAARRSTPERTRPERGAHVRGPYGGRQAEALRPYIGKWVALGDPCEVLVAADTPEEIVAWLTRHGRIAKGGMFRVPATAAETEILGGP
jgi:hypothetical protein